MKNELCIDCEGKMIQDMCDKCQIIIWKEEMEKEYRRKMMRDHNDAMQNPYHIYEIEEIDPYVRFDNELD